MPPSPQRGSILIKLIILCAILGGAYFVKAPDGESFLSKAAWWARHGYDSVIQVAKDARNAAQEHENVTQAAVDAN